MKATCAFGSGVVGLLLALALVMIACDSDIGLEPLEQPIICSIHPADGAMSVPVKTGIAVEFSTPIDPATVTPETFFLQGSVTGSIVCDDCTAIFWPDESLGYRRRYYAELCGDIRDLNGQPLNDNRTWSFVTVGRPPEIDSIWPTKGYEGVHVSIYGRNFSSYGPFNTVGFSGVSAEVVSASPGRLVAMVPRRAVTGKVSVKTSSGVSATWGDFVVFQAGDVISVINYPQSATTRSLLDVVWDGRQFVAVGNMGTVITSPNGIDWARREVPVTSRLTGITWTGAVLIAVGAGGTIITSADGITWHLQNSDTTATLTDVTPGPFKVAVGMDGLTISSPDTRGWTPAANRTGECLNGVARTSYGYIAVGDHGVLLRSTTGRSWQLIDSGTDEHLLAVTHAVGQTIAVGYYGTIITSDDGRVWVAQSSGTVSHLGGITYTGSETIVAGDDGVILMSSDGVNWEIKNAGVTTSFNSVASSGARIVAVGDNGTIVISPYLPGLP